MYGNLYLFRRLFYICFDLKSYIFPVIIAGAAMVMGAVQFGFGVAERNAARKKQEQAYNQMIQIAEDKMNYAKELDTEWKNAYGTTTDQVAEYYSNLTGESMRQQYQMSGDKALEQSYNNFQEQRKQLQAKINQMGMQNSSQALSALMQMSTQQMSNNAAINFETNLNKMRADSEVTQQKLAYNQTGQYLKQASINMKDSAFNTQLAAQQAKLGVAAQQEASADQMASSGLQNISNGLNMGLNSYSTKLDRQNELVKVGMQQEHDLTMKQAAWYEKQNPKSSPLENIGKARIDVKNSITGGI